MRDYWLTQYILAAVGWGYVIVSLIAIALALWLPKGKGSKVVATLIVLGIASIFPIQGLQGYMKEKDAAEAYQEKLAQAQALFAERCKTAGERIYRTVENVEGVFLMKIRPDKINFSEQYLLDDPYGQQNWRGEGYVEEFLAGRADAYWLTDKTTKSAYRFVEVVDRATQKVLTYTFISAGKEHQNKLHLVSLDKLERTARFAVDWQDESTRADRDSWIACGSVSVLDIDTKEILGKRTGCMLDVGVGATSGGRSPWAFARDTACPASRKTPDGRAIFDPVDRNFVEKVLKPNEGK